MINVIYIGHSNIGLSRNIHFIECDEHRIVATFDNVSDAEVFVQEQPYGYTYVFESKED